MSTKYYNIDQGIVQIVEESVPLSVDLTTGNSIQALSAIKFVNAPAAINPTNPQANTFIYDATNGIDYVIMDNQYNPASPDGVNAEHILITGEISAAGVLESVSIKNAVTSSLGYKIANGAKILIPGVEVIPQNSDYNLRLRGQTLAITIDFDDEASKYATGDHAEDFAIPGFQKAAVSVTEKISVPATTISGPAFPLWSKLLSAMGLQLSEYVTGGTLKGMGFRRLAAADDITCTVYITEKQAGASPTAMQWRISGAKASGTLGASGNSPVLTLVANLTGVFQGNQTITNANIPQLTSPETAIPVVMKNTTVALKDFTVASPTTLQRAITKFSLDFGNDIQPIIGQYSSTGYLYFFIASSKPKLILDPLQLPKETEDLEAIVQTNEPRTLDISFTNSSPVLTLEVPNAQLAPHPTFGANNGLRSHERSYRCLRNNLGSSYGGGAANTALPDECVFELLIGTRS